MKDVYLQTELNSVNGFLLQASMSNKIFFFLGVFNLFVSCHAPFVLDYSTTLSYSQRAFETWFSSSFPATTWFTTDCLSLFSRRGIGGLPSSRLMKARGSVAAGDDSSIPGEKYYK